MQTSTWWATSDSVDPTDPVVVTAQGATRQIVLAILVGSVLVQAIRLATSRKAEPLAMVATGLVRFLIVSALGLTCCTSGSAPETRSAATSSTTPPAGLPPSWNSSSPKATSTTSW